MRRFYVYRRGQVFYAQLLNPQTGRLLPGRSTGARTRDEALIVAHEWLERGIPAGRYKKPRPVDELATLDAILSQLRTCPLTVEDAARVIEALEKRGLVHSAISLQSPSMEPFIDFLRGFWSFDSSAYVREKIAHGQRITRRHCIDMRGRIKHWEADFASSHLGEITRKQLSDFGVSLSQKGLAPASINKIITAGAVALRWAFENEMIPTNPAAGLKTFSGFAHKRGILEPEEVRALFATEWEDERAKVACLTAATTGLRMGEILALRPSDVGVDRLYVRHSWGITEGLKCPKNGEEREVPLLPGMRESLLSLASRNPHKVGDAGFIFFGRYPDRPLDANRILFGMRKALVSMDGVSWVDVDSRKALDLPRFRGEVVKPLSLIPPRAA